MVCTSQKIIFRNKAPVTKNSLKNTFPLYQKSASFGKKSEENGFHKQENVFLLKLVLLISNSRKKSLNKSMFPLGR